MAGGGGKQSHGRSSPAKQSPPATRPSKRKFSSGHHRGIKRQIVDTTSETETKTLTLIPKSTCTSTSTAPLDTSTHTNSRTRIHSEHRKKHHSRKVKRKHISTEDRRHWTYSPHDCSNYKDRVVFMSYNILGVENAAKHEDLYTNVRPEYLDWEHRKRQLYKEIKRYTPGILCFQEVDRFHDLESRLLKDGYQGVYQARTGEACDGCAVFWRNELFTLLHEESIEFQRFGLRNNVAQFCVLKMNQSISESGEQSQTSKDASSRSFVIGNIHVLFNPSRGDIKLGQMRMFLEKAQSLSSEWGRIPVVIAGDLNSMPQSAIYQFLASSKLDIRLHDRRMISGQICPVQYKTFQAKNGRAARYYPSSRPSFHRWSNEELWLATGGEGDCFMRHHLKLCSAYAGVPGSTNIRDNVGEPLATSFHSKFMGTVDYIWHTQELVPLRVLETLPINILRKTRGLPSQKWGSDHLALVCELAFVDDKHES